MSVIFLCTSFLCRDDSIDETVSGFVAFCATLNEFLPKVEQSAAAADPWDQCFRMMHRDSESSAVGHVHHSSRSST